ncbi:hypothetical protein GCM10009422_03860 [Brevundimonas kwangchunensis]|uniref:Uncharacterized protein n=1 Tax=Brevundimonas kwangchunensis TaxID=322163 RepID=A0ABP3RM03_9CAUL
MGSGTVSDMGFLRDADGGDAGRKTAPVAAEFRLATFSLRVSLSFQDAPYLFTDQAYDGLSGWSAGGISG